MKEKILSRLILFGEYTLWQLLKEYDTHYHHEPNHQGKGNELLMPLGSQAGLSSQSIRTRERLGGLLKFYYQEAAEFFDHTGIDASAADRSYRAVAEHA